MAHAILLAQATKRSLVVEVYSAGVFDFSDAPALAETANVCLQHNTPPPKASPTFVRELPLDAIDRFLVMEQYHADVLESEFGVSPDRISLLGTFDPQRRGEEIADPFGHSSRGYERSYKLIRDCINGYLDTTDDLR
jgi:protein-tyrosine-phosphatase